VSGGAPPVAFAAVSSAARKTKKVVEVVETTREKHFAFL
jgi:hypothetical protein